jgi:raffinose/stachyose/melibiose transport system substrate-binding protein
MKSRILMITVAVFLLSGVLTWSTGQSEATAKVRLTFIHFWGGDNPAAEPIKKALDLFSARHPDITVKVEEYPTDDVYVPRLNADFAAGTVPDVFLSWPGPLSKPYVESGKLLDLETYLKKDQEWNDWFIPGTVEQCKYKGFQGSVPLEGFSVPIFYNKEIFARFGVKPPNTYDELMSLIDRFRSGGLVPLTAFIDNGWTCALYWFVMSHRLVGVEQARAACQVGDFSNPGFVEAAKRLLDFRNKEAFPNNFIGSSNPESENLFLTGKAAMFHHGTWWIGSFQKDGPPGFLDKIGYFNFPNMPGGKGSNKDWLSGVIVSVAGAKSLENNEARLKAGLALIKHISSPEVAKLFSEESQRPTCVKTNLDEAKFGALNKALLQDVGSGNNTFTLHSLAVPPLMRRAIEDELTALWLGDKTPEQAVAKITESAGEAYK